MALVAYEYSDSSEVESENENDDKQTEKPSVVELIPQTNNNRGNEENTSSGLFSSLPKPKQHPASEIIEEEEDDILLKYKNKPQQSAATKSKVKITIPSLSSYHSDEEDATPKKIIQKAPEKASGLFAVLPSPKCPAPEKRKFDASVVKQKNLVPRTVKANQQKKAAKRAVESDDEDTPSDGNFFSSIFSNTKINAAPSVVPASNILNIQVDSAQPVRDINTKSNNYFANLVAEATKKPEPEPEEPEEDFEEKAVKELCGKNKHKRMKGEDIKMVDINATDIMPDPRDWRTKALTEEDNTPTVKKGEEPSVQSKRKHQITYLAYQAKVNEQELKNQWALNRMTRKQTQAKYGF